MKTTKNEGLLISNEIIEKADLGDCIRLIATDKLITLTKSDMTAMDIVKTIDALTEVLHGYIETLKENCGSCDGCDYCDEMDFEGIHLPPDVLAMAGISADAKLNAYVEEDAGVIHIEEAEYDYDISDISAPLLELFEAYGICLGELDALLVGGDVLNG